MAPENCAGTSQTVSQIAQEDGDHQTARLELACGRIQRAFGFDPVEDLHTLTPMNRGQVGTNNLNVELLKAVNPKQDGLVRWARSYWVNDKDVFKGDIGRIKRFYGGNQKVTISFDGRDVLYDYSELDEVILAYAVSVHKSQGSEYACVVIPIMTQHYVLLQRNLLYTAITRGKKLVVIVGSKRPWPSPSRITGGRRDILI